MVLDETIPVSETRCCALYECELLECMTDVKECLGAASVSRDPNNGCQFPACPAPACDHSVRQCADGSQVSRNANNNCEFDACPDPCDGKDCGEGGTCNPSIGACACDNDYTLSLDTCIEKTASALPSLRRGMSMLATKNGPAYMCDIVTGSHTNRCAKTSSLGAKWATLPSWIINVLAADLNGRVLFVLDSDNYVRKSADYGASWSRGYDVHTEYISTVQADHHSYTHFESAFMSTISKDDDGVPTSFDFTTSTGAAWTASTSEVVGWTADRAYSYSTPWGSTAPAERTIHYCTDLCKDKDCGAFGRCVMLTGECECLERFSGASCEVSPN